MKLFLITVFSLVLSSASVPPCPVLSSVRVLDSWLKPHGDRHRLVMEEAQSFVKGLTANPQPGVKLSTLGYSEGHPIYRIDIGPKATGAKNLPKIAIFSGVHGNEPIAVATVFQFISSLANNHPLREKYQFVIFPMVNPKGLELVTRQNGAGEDLNRTWAADKFVGPSQLIARSLEGESFVLSLDMHGSNGRDGFYLVRGKEDGGLSERIMRGIRKDLRLKSDTDTYPGRAQIRKAKHLHYKIDHPGVAQSNNVATLKEFMASKGTPFSYTVEYPGTIGVEVQARVMLRLLYSTINNFNAMTR